MEMRDVVATERKGLEERIRFWRQVRNQAKQVVSGLEAALRALELSFDQPTLNSQPLPNDTTEARYEGMSIPEAAIAYLRACEEPRTTSEIARELFAGGIKSHAKRPTASVYGTLIGVVKRGANSPLVKLSDGRWSLRELDSPNQKGGDDDG